MNRKTRNRIVAGADLTQQFLEEIPAVGAASKGERAAKNIYTLATGRRLKLSDLPPAVRRMERLR